MDNEIWMQMGQFSGLGIILGDYKSIKVGDVVDVRPINNEPHEFESCTIYEYGKYSKTDCKNRNWWAIPISDWWK